MKVLVIQGSPKRDKGNTHTILAPFLEGAKEAGANIELVFADNLKMKPCRGEQHCMFETPGECILNDDMKLLYRKLASSDIWVFASPVYFGGFTSQIRNILERMCPLLEPYFEIYEDHIGHPWRDAVKVRRIALVSSCGTPEISNFDALVAELQCICRKCGRNGVLTTKFAGALLRPSGGDFKTMKDRGIPLDDIILAAKEAGGQLVGEGMMSPSTLNIVSRALTIQPKEDIVVTKNQYIRQMMSNRE